MDHPKEQGTESTASGGRLQRLGRRAVRELPWLLILLAIYWAVSSSQTVEIEMGERPPPIRAPLIGGGGGVDTAELRGKPLVLVFWAPWCRVCSVEMPLLGELQQSFGERASVLGVGLSGSRAEMDEFAAKHGSGFPQVYGDQRISSAYGIRAFPTILILDSEGRVQHQFVGLTTRWRLQWSVSRLVDEG